MDEVFLVTKGVLTLDLSGTQQQLPAGGTAYVPRCSVP